MKSLRLVCCDEHSDGSGFEESEQNPAATDVSVDISVDTSVDTRSSIGRCIDRDLVVYRPIAQLMMLMVSVDVSTAIPSLVNRSTIGYISVDCRSSLDQYSTEYRSTVGQYLVSLNVQ